MRILFLETKMGAAGDMLMSALFELCDRKDEFLNTMNTIFPDIIKVSPTSKSQNGVIGTHMLVEIYGKEELDHAHSHDHEHSHDHDHVHTHKHYSYHDICHEIEHLQVSDSVKKHAKEIYELIGKAEAKVHNSDLDNIHFHEVGSLDAIADVVGCAILMDMISADKIICTPIHVGNGTVKCAHGILPVPAPATAEILKGLPIYTGDINSELCTPTGAAILKHYVDEFNSMPMMTIEKIGLGMGTKEFPIANAVRAFLGDSNQIDNDEILDISCNIDDMTGEALGFAMELLLDQGALDVFYQPIYMKKNRPGTLLHCFCKLEDQDKFIQLILKHTSTRGLRYQRFHRAKLTSHFKTVETKYGPVNIKHSEGYGIHKSKPEFEDIKALAQKHDVSLDDILKEIKRG